MPDFHSVSHPFRNWAMALADAEQRVPDAMRESEHEAGMVLAYEVQQRMVDHPGWQESPHLAANVAVFEHQGATKVGIPPGEESAEAFSYEYGDEVTAPAPVLRATLSDHYEQLSAYLGESFERRLFGAPGPQ